MIYAKPSTSLVVVFRAYLASDHVTPATGKTIAITISKNGGAFGNPNAGATNATEISSGFYKVTLDTTDTGTAGPLAVRGAVATVDDVGILYYVGQAPADVTHFGGTAATTSGGRPEVNTTHAAGTAWGSGAITAGSIASDAITAAKIATGAIDADAIAADAITAAKVAADVSAEIADAVWDEATSGHTTAGSTGKAVIDILEDTGTTLDGRLPAALVGGRMDANVGAISTDATAADNLEAMLDGTGGVTLTTALTGPITGNITGSLSGSVGSVTGDVGGAVNSVTGNVGGNVTGSVGSLAAQAKADVNAEVLDVLNVDTFAEPGQEAPAATNTLVKKIGYLFKFLRNKVTQTSTTMSVYADDATTVDQKSTVSDDGTTYTRGEIASGP